MTTPPLPNDAIPPSPSNDQSSPPPELLPPPQQGPPPNPPPTLPPSTPPPAPPAPPPVPALPPPSFPPPTQPSPQKPPPATQPPPNVPTPVPPSSSPPPPSTTPASSPPPPSAPSVPSPTLPTPASPATPTTPVPSWSPPPPGSATPSPPSPASISPPPPSTAGRSPPAHGSPPSSSTTSSSSNSTTILIAVIGSLAAALVIFGLLFFCCWKKRRRNSGRGSGGYPPAMNRGHDRATNVIYFHPPPPPYGNIPIDSSGSESYPHAYPGVGLNMLKNSFTLEELSQATNGFSEANLLGQGGFGYVHKGILPNGEEVAIKQLKAGSGQGELEFQAEVEIIGRVHHKHLVSLVGYSITGPHRLLIYEFLPNDTLHFHLHGNGGEAMDWPKRLRIALGSARGLAYLHEDCYPKIIHRDIKAANILLDFRFEAKVADFGLAKFCSDGNTHISTRVMGTFGYLAPEYASSGKLTEKSDVYSFGVVLLELITGRKPLISTENMGESLVDWAKPYLAQAVEDEKFDALVDPRLQNDYDPNQMLRMVACAATSVRYSAKYRPKMSQIVRVLEGNMSAAELMEGTKANARSVGSSQEILNSEYNTSQYNNDLSRFRRLAFESQTYQSSGIPLPPSTQKYTSTQEMEKGRQ